MEVFNFVYENRYCTIFVPVQSKYSKYKFSLLPVTTSETLFKCPQEAILCMKTRNLEKYSEIRI